MMETPAADNKSAHPGGLPLYLSPYEYWNFGAGKGYAFPAIRKYLRFISAFAELVKNEPINTIEPLEGKAHLPTLWDKYDPPRFLPFVVETALGSAIPDVNRLRGLLRTGLREVVQFFVQLQTVDIKAARFRIALPVADAAMHPELDRPGDPECHPDPGLRECIKDKQLTVMAVVDDDVPFAHRNF